MRLCVRQVAFSASILALAAYVLTRDSYLPLLHKVTLLEFTVATLICVLIFSFSGLKIFLIADGYFRKRISVSDIVTLPIMMNLSSFFLPIKGGVLFQIFFLKMKYKLSLTGGLSISAYNHLMVFVLYGMIGLLYALATDNLLSSLGVVSLLLSTSPLLVSSTFRVMSKIELPDIQIIIRISKFLHEIADNHDNLWRNSSILFNLFIVSMLHTASRILWIYYATRVFDVDITILAVIVVAFLTELSVIFRFVPGNIGLYEFASGTAFEIIGESMEIGVFIALFLRLITIIVTFSIGLVAINANLKCFELDDIKSIWGTLKKQS